MVSGTAFDGKLSDEWMAWWTQLHCRLLVLEVASIHWSWAGNWRGVDRGSWCESWLVS